MLKDTLREQSMTDILKSWMMVALTFIFVVLYTAALLGWLKPLTDVTIISRLEPIIFVIIGYYFGRLPAQQNEKTLKDEISRQTQRTDAAQHAKEQALQVRESIEEKINNAKVALSQKPINSSLGYVDDINKNTNFKDKSQPVNILIETAINILSS